MPGWAPALVAVAALQLLASIVLFVAVPLSEMPVYLVQRYFVLDATSMLFLLVINAVFLGISVYMSSRVSTSRIMAQKILPRALLSLAFMLAMNIGIMANNLLVLWVFMELTTLCAAPLVAQAESAQARRVAWQYMLYSSMSLALTFLGFLCLTRSAGLQGMELAFAIDQMAATLPVTTDSWQRLGFALVLFGRTSWVWRRSTAGCPSLTIPPPPAPAPCWPRCTSTSASWRCSACCRSCMRGRSVS